MNGVVGSKMRLVVNICDCTVQRLLFADELVQLDSTQNGLQQALDRFLDLCSTQWRNKGWGGGAERAEARGPTTFSGPTNLHLSKSFFLTQNIFDF